MRRDRNALKSGVFIILTVVLIIAVIVGIKGAENLSEPKDLRAVSFDLKSDVGGLQVGDDVRVGGFKVGTVKEITVVGADQESAKDLPRVRVVFSFPKRYLLRRDALLRIQSTVTGQSCLNFEALGTGAKLPANEELAGRAGTLSEVLAAVGQLSGPVTHIIDTVDHTTLPAVNTTVSKFGGTADSFKATGDHATQLVDDARAQVPTAMDRYKAVMETANAALGKIRDFFGDSSSDFRSTLTHFASISKTIDQKMPSIVENVDGVLKKVNTSVTSANAALEDIKVVAANARDITGAGKDVIVGNRGKIDSMITSLKATGKNLEAATVEIRRSPWRLLYKPAPNEMANLNLYDAARQFADGATELNDASLALRDAMRNGNADRETVEKLMVKLNGSFENFQKVENQLWTKVKE